MVAKAPGRRKFSARSPRSSTTARRRGARPLPPPLQLPFPVSTNWRPARRAGHLLAASRIVCLPCSETTRLPEREAARSAKRTDRQRREKVGKAGAPPRAGRRGDRGGDRAMSSYGPGRAEKKQLGAEMRARLGTPRRSPQEPRTPAPLPRVAAKGARGEALRSPASRRGGCSEARHLGRTGWAGPNSPRHGRSKSHADGRHVARGHPRNREEAGQRDRNARCDPQEARGDWLILAYPRGSTIPETPPPLISFQIRPSLRPARATPAHPAPASPIRPLPHSACSQPELWGGGDLATAARGATRRGPERHVGHRRARKERESEGAWSDRVLPAATLRLGTPTARLGDVATRVAIEAPHAASSAPPWRARGRGVCGRARMCGAVSQWRAKRADCATMS